MSRNNYNVSEQFNNLTRQDTRQEINESDSMIEESDYNPNSLDLFKDGMDDFKELPKFLKPVFISLAKKHASLRCRLLNNINKISELESALEQDQLPTSIRYQAKYLEKRYSDVQTLSELYEKLIESEKNRLKSQNAETKAQLSNRVAELDELLLPITNRSDLMKEIKSNSALILDCLTETEYCSMLLKMEQDKKIKAIKKEKYAAQKETNDSIAAITNRQLTQLTKQIKSLQLQVKVNAQTKQKNGKGQAGKKKSVKPRATKEGKKSKKPKGNGNSKGTSKNRQ